MQLCALSSLASDLRAAHSKTLEEDIQFVHDEGMEKSQTRNWRHHHKREQVERGGGSEGFPIVVRGRRSHICVDMHYPFSPLGLIKFIN